MKFGYYTRGSYDFMAVIEFPDDQKMLSFSMRLAEMGHLHFQTLKPFPMEDTLKIIQDLP